MYIFDDKSYGKNLFILRMRFFVAPQSNHLDSTNGALEPEEIWSPRGSEEQRRETDDDVTGL